MAKILIVMNDQRTANALSAALQADGHTCGTYNRGKRVVEIAGEQDVDLVIVGIMLQDVSGFEVCRRIRRNPTLYTLPVVLLSAMTDPEEVKHGLAQGADGYFPVSAPIPDLVQDINRILNSTTREVFTDAATGLPNAAGLRRGLQQRISRREAFALVYIELLNLREFAPEQGEDARHKALRHLTRALHQYGREAGDDFFAGHMGGGHFVCTTASGSANEYCKRLRRAWQEHLPRLYDAVGRNQEHRQLQAEDPSRLLNVLCCITVNDPRNLIPAQELLDVVMRIRRNHVAEAGGGVYVDRRAAPQM